MRSNLYEALREALGVAVASARPLSGGCIGEVYLVGLEAPLEDGGTRRVVAKVDQSSAPRLDVEGFMLEYLAGHSALPVPHVFHASPGLLVMAHVEGESHFSSSAQRHAADVLAALHAIAAPQHGLERPTLIGGLEQPNPRTDSWIEFFGDHRLRYMAEEGVREGCVPRAIYKRLVQFVERLGDFIEEPPHPSLLHGDAWTTNILAAEGRITAFLDPAIYHGHPEIELAFTTLFSTFGQHFFDRYHELRPIPAGFFEGAGGKPGAPGRKDIYNLYPLLVHARLFGSSYLGGVESTLRGFGF